MPVVPIFQGGVPQTPDSGNAGGAIIQEPRPAFDYGTAMKKAMEPLENFAGSLQKYVEVEEARDLKAQSDDAETDFMRRVQERMLNPETGYLTTKQRDAVDGFDSVNSGLKQDYDEILGGLPPRVQEVVKSRMQERLLSAQGQAMRWRNAQGDAYHLSSSKSRAETITDDAAQHYGDEDYLAKSWLSVAQEVEYQAKLQGMDEEQRSALMQAHYESFQANRFATWAQDDPVSALAGLKATKGLSADIEGKLDTSIWQAAKGQLALQLATTMPGFASKKDLAAAALSPNTKTGIPLVDELKPARKAELFALANSYSERATAERKNGLSVEIKNSIARCSETGEDPQMLSEDMFVEAYGSEDGAQRYRSYQADAAVAAWGHNLEKMPDAAIVATINAAAPKPGSPDYAEQKENRDRMLQAYAKVKKLRADDPMLAALGSGSYGLNGINWDTETGQGLAQRVTASERVAEDYGTPQALLTKDEAQGLNDRLSKMSPVEAGAFLRKLSGGIGQENMLTLAKQLDGKQVNGALFLADPHLSEYATTYLQGRQALAEKQASVSWIESDPTLGTKAQWERFNGLYGDPKLRENLMDAVEGVAAGMVLNSKATMSDAFDKAFEAVVGEVEDYNGRKIALKDGATVYDVRRTVAGIREQYSKKQGVVASTPGGVRFTGPAFGKYLLNAQLIPAPETNAFYVAAGDDLIYDTHGRPFVISVEASK